MPDLLGRELTGEERKVEAALRHALLTVDKRSSVSSIRAIAAENPEEFVAASLMMLGSRFAADFHRRYLGLLECPEFLLLLIQSSQFDRPRLLEVCRSLKQIDDSLDVRLARLAPGRRENGSGLAPELILRLLDILHEISSGPRLIQILGHLVHHPDERLASKASMLIGRRLRNHNWVRAQLESPDPRIRANVVEGLWGVQTPVARKCMWEALQDENNRVAGNALMGLHLLGDPGADQLVTEMLRDVRPQFRRTAAWLMGRIAKPEFEDCLLHAAADEDPGVRQTATCALAVFRKNKEPAQAGSVLAPELPALPAVPSLAAAPLEEKPPEAVATPPCFAPHFDGKYISGL
jgi:HEAT repeats